MDFLVNLVLAIIASIIIFSNQIQQVSPLGIAHVNSEVTQLTTLGTDVSQYCAENVNNSSASKVCSSTSAVQLGGSGGETLPGVTGYIPAPSINSNVSGSAFQGFETTSNGATAYVVYDPTPILGSTLAGLVQTYTAGTPPTPGSTTPTSTYYLTYDPCVGVYAASAKPTTALC